MSLESALDNLGDFQRANAHASEAWKIESHIQQGRSRRRSQLHIGRAFHASNHGGQFESNLIQRQKVMTIEVNDDRGGIARNRLLDAFR